MNILMNNFNIVVFGKTFWFFININKKECDNLLIPVDNILNWKYNKYNIFNVVHHQLHWFLERRSLSKDGPRYTTLWITWSYCINDITTWAEEQFVKRCWQTLFVCKMIRFCYHLYTASQLSGFSGVLSWCLRYVMIYWFISGIIFEAVSWLLKCIARRILRWVTKCSKNDLQCL